MSKPAPDLSRQTVLFGWALRNLGVVVEDREPLAEFSRVHGLGPDRPVTEPHPVSPRIEAALRQTYRTPMPPTVEQVARWEENLARHTATLNAARRRHGEREVAWTYFQYLGLLLTEMYLEAYFFDPVGLRASINGYIEDEHNGFHRGRGRGVNVVEPFPVDGPDAVPERQLGRLAFWCATGGGKTLLLHTHIRQYRHHAARAGRKPDAVLVVTPNEGLSAQHADELRRSGFRAEAAGEAGLPLLGPAEVEVRDIHKLTEEPVGSENVRPTAEYAGHNLVLVDEAHTGLKGKAGAGWQRRREDLGRGGFTFLYSATFKEAVDALGRKDAAAWRGRFGRSVLLDYSYPRFYRDGYGKDFEVLNLRRGGEAALEGAARRRYLTVALLRFTRQLAAYERLGPRVDAFGLDKPLWMFVGGTVVGDAAPKDEKQATSDLVRVLRFFEGFCRDRERAVADVAALLADGFRTGGERDLMEGGLSPLEPDAEALVGEAYRRVFGSPGGGVLRVWPLSGEAAAGELAVSVNDRPPFAVAFVGDAAGLARVAGEAGIGTQPRGPAGVAGGGGSLFRGIDRPGSPVNVLLGAKRFKEGWNSHRVASLGLMHVGKGQGAEIVQLFGRGVRLRGHGHGMRRSSALRLRRADLPEHLPRLETLQVAGVEAAAMEAFEAWVRDTTPEVLERRVCEVPVVQLKPRPGLKTLGLPREIGEPPAPRKVAFERLGPVVRLEPPAEGDAWLAKNPVVLDLLPRVDALSGSGGLMVREGGTELKNADGPLEPWQVALLDLDGLVWEVEAHATRVGGALKRLHADRAGVLALLHDPSWYTLRMPSADREPGGRERVTAWQSVAATLLRRYAERLCKQRRGVWEAPYLSLRELEPAELREDRPWLVEPATPGSADEVRQWVDALNAAVAATPPEGWKAPGGLWGTADFGGHLYRPLLLAQRGAAVKIRPVALNDGEAGFVEKLREHREERGLGGVHLLRNDAVGGLGFFEAANYFPDFLLWREIDGRQHLMLLDPKGLGRVGFEDPKVRFATELLPRIQERLDAAAGGPGAAPVRLSAALLSVTPRADLNWVRAHRDAAESRGVFFLEERGVMDRLFSWMLGGGS